MTEDLNAMAVFAALAEAKSFRVAGERLGVTASAVSQTLRRLEARLGGALVRRTTRSVHLTAAGERLYAAVRPALDEVRAAAAAVGATTGEPRGTLRLYVSAVAQSYLSGPLLAGFLDDHPHVQLDVVVGDARLDIVAEGYDAGIRIGEVIDRDMIAVPVSGDLRLVVVGAPAYFARRGVPRHPRDLVDHVCLGWHPTADAPPYRWEFTEDGREFAVAVPARVLSTDTGLNLRLSRAGVGLAFLFEDKVRDDVARGALVPVLEAYSNPFPGYYLYYPERRHASAALRALVDHLRGTRQGPRSDRAAPHRGQTPRAAGAPGRR